MAQINFGNVQEEVITRAEFPLEKARTILKDKTIAVLGYGVQGPGQALNLRDNGFKVLVGQRRSSASWAKALEDGWKPGETLFEPEAACAQAEVIMNLLSDAGQMQTWAQLLPCLSPGKTLYFSHGFGLAFPSKTGMQPPEGIDVVLVAPKGSGTSLRRLFLEGKGLNASYAVFQDSSGSARDTALALGMGIGSAYLFETTFQKEAYSDLTGERGVLMGALAGLFEAQYGVLRDHGHSPSEAFNETVEELTQSLMPLVAEQGMDWMYANCSTTAQRGALDWKEKFRAATEPVFRNLYDSVAAGKEAEIVIEKNSRPDYRRHLEQELLVLHQSELWQAGAAVRKLRPE